VQIIAAPWREDIALRVAQALEKMGVVAARRSVVAEPASKAKTEGKGSAVGSRSD
jgi:hypothetical protein